MGATDKEKILQILKQAASHAFLATCDGDQPVVRSISPIVEDDFSIWVTTSTGANKVRQIRKNPKVCCLFAVQPTGENSAAVYGRAQIVTDLGTKKRIWSLASFDLLQYIPGGPESPEYGLLKIVPDEVLWRDGWAEGTKIYRPARD
jgi:general stress protein 26